MPKQAGKGPGRRIKTDIALGRPSRCSLPSEILSSTLSHSEHVFQEGTSDNFIVCPLYGSLHSSAILLSKNNKCIFSISKLFTN